MNETSTPPPGQPGSPQDGPRVTREQMKDVNRLRRPRERMIAGVAAGLARHFDVDPLVVRVTLVVLCFFGGAGFVLYGAGWLLMPEDGAEQAPLHLDERSRTAALVIAAALAAMALLGDTTGVYWFPWPLAVLAAVVWLLVARRQDRNAQRPGTAYAPPPTPYGQPVPGTQAPDPQSPYAQAPPTAPTATYAPAAAPYAAAPAPQPSAPYGSGAQVAPRPPLARPRDPRRRGPILFGFTVALVALAMGVLGTVDLAGADVVGSAYPALALTVISAMLLIGSFWGRAGGLIFLALVAAVATFAATASESWTTSTVEMAPTRASEVAETYQMKQGELVIDLSRVSDPEALDAKSVGIDVGAGLLVVVLPDDIQVRAEVAIGAGSWRVTHRGESSGLGLRETFTIPPARADQDVDEELDEEAPSLHLDLDMGAGMVIVRRASEPPMAHGDGWSATAGAHETRQEALR